MPDSQPSVFQPFVSPNDRPPEFTFRAILLGSIFGIIFGAVTVYVGLRAGLTVAASIPIAVLSISILRAFGRSSILENNIVQTTGNAGQSIASGVIFTLPALVFLGFDLQYSRIFMLALIGGWLGVLFMIPLRRQLIVQEHSTLPYPEGTACADVLMAGERGGSFASRVFLGLGLGGRAGLGVQEVIAVGHDVGDQVGARDGRLDAGSHLLLVLVPLGRLSRSLRCGGGLGDDLLGRRPGLARLLRQRLRGRRNRLLRIR